MFLIRYLLPLAEIRTVEVVVVVVDVTVLVVVVVVLVVCKGGTSVALGGDGKMEAPKLHDTEKDLLAEYTSVWVRTKFPELPISADSISCP